MLCWLALALLPWLYAVRYCHPSNDDYFNAVWDDFGAYQRWLYFHNTGRYFSSLLVSLTPLHWHSLTGYRAAAVLLIIATAAVAFIALLKLCAEAVLCSKSVRYAIAAGGVAVLFNGMPSPEQGLYWYTGAATYTVGALLFALFLLLCLRLHRAADSTGLFKGFVPAAALLLCVTGSNESIIPLPIIVCGALAFYYKRIGKSSLTRFYACLLIVCCAGAAAALLAPGNGERQDTIPRSLLVALPSWLLFTKDLALGWLKEPLLGLYSLGVLIAARRVELRVRVPLWAAFLLPLALACVVTLPGFWALGRMPPYRVQNVAYFFFLLLWAFFLLQLAGRMGALWDDARPIARPLRGMLGIAAFVWALQGFTVDELRRSSNYFLLAKNMAQGTLHAFDGELETRYAVMRASAGRDIALPPLRYRQHNTLYFADIGPDTGAFPNPAYAKYWGLRSVRLDTAGEGTR